MFSAWLRVLYRWAWPSRAAELRAPQGTLAEGENLYSVPREKTSFRATILTYAHPGRPGPELSICIPARRDYHGLWTTAAASPQFNEETNSLIAEFGLAAV